MTELLLFGKEYPSVYNIEDIYDPDIHGSDPTAAGKIVPAIKSLVLDANNIIYVVTAVNVVTLKSTLSNGRIVTEDNSSIDTLISYGNEQYILYYDPRAVPTKVVIDSKLILFGTNSVEYKLMKTIDGTPASIASFIDVDGDITSDRIPMSGTTVPGTTKPANCHTLFDLTDGDIVVLNIYDGSGILTTIVELICKQASILNDLTASANPITAFNATCSQESNDKWLLYVGQDPEHLAIFPELVYADGQKEYVTINNQNCFLYGMEDVATNYPGMEFKLILKYFLPSQVESPISEGTVNKFVSFEKWLRVDVASKHEYSKISVLPIWNTSTEQWDLTFYAYYQTRNTYKDITIDVGYTTGMLYDPELIMEQQTFQIEVSYIPEGEVAITQVYTQPITLTLRNTTDSEPFLIADSVNSAFVYGSSDALHKRPAIHYDASLEQYFIPTSLFSDAAIFLENFYTNSNPPYLSETEIVAPTPTYFTIREISSGRVLLPVPLSVTSYAQAFNMLHISTPNQFVGNTVVVEFLTANAETYNILFGVPVSVENSLTGYNL